MHFATETSLVTAALAVVALRDPAIEKWRALAQLPRMLGPAIVVFVMWRWYVMTNVPHGDVAFRSFDAWNFALLPTIFAAIWGHITGAPLFHAMMWIVTVAGFAAFFTLPRKVSEARRLAVVCDGACDRTLASMDKPARRGACACGGSTGALRPAGTQRSQQSRRGRKGVAPLHPTGHNRDAARDASWVQGGDHTVLE
jgi:hypothetical protein